VSDIHFSMSAESILRQRTRSMLAIGLSWKQALPAIAVGHIIIAVIMVRLVAVEPRMFGC
jgi:cytosine/uracil/thiamine/allantoin permease